MHQTKFPSKVLTGMPLGRHYSYTVSDDLLPNQMVAPSYHYGRQGMQIFQVVSEFAPVHRNPMVLINWFNTVKYLLRYHRKSKRAQRLLDLRKCYTSLVQLLEIYEHDEWSAINRHTAPDDKGVPQNQQVPVEFLGAPLNAKLPGQLSKTLLDGGEGGVGSASTGSDNQPRGNKHRVKTKDKSV